LVYPDQPEYGIDFIFNNFTLGYYDSAKVTKITDGQIWINIDLIDDGRGTLVEGGPDLWTDLVQLNFISNNIVTSDVVFWETYSNYWSIYDSDNFTKWEKGTFDNVTTSLENEDITNNDFNYSLNQNYPNPFNPLTTIQYSVNKESWVKLIVYNAIGQEVKTLVDETKQIGTYRTGFDATNLTSGIYFYKLQAGDPSTGSGQAFVETKKMILMK
ncbi:MAG: T9SS type A sorting domain-containing protein, partial [Ignavibacteria bacterium]|nr:T9SS type A sorting domain-containing protein [Ignavibacteria bacterium]